jgi:hypothetical protein
MNTIEFNKHDVDIFINGTWQKYAGNIGWLFKITRLFELRFWPFSALTRQQLKTENNKLNIYTQYLMKSTFETIWLFFSQTLNSKTAGNKVKKTHKPRYCEKEKDKANKRILRSLSFDSNGLVKTSCGTVDLYGPFVFFKDMADYLWIILAEVCKLKYSIKKLGEKIQALCMVFTRGEIWTLKLMGFFFQKHLMFCSLWSTFFGPQNARFQELPPPGPLTTLSQIF